LRYLRRTGGQGCRDRQFSGRDVNKFESFHLTPGKAERVSAPLIAECFANIECSVVDTRLVNRYNFSFWKD